MEDCHKFKACLGYPVRPCLKNKQETKWRNTKPKGQELWACRRSRKSSQQLHGNRCNRKCHSDLQRWKPTPPHFLELGQGLRWWRPSAVKVSKESGRKRKGRRACHPQTARYTKAAQLHSEKENSWDQQEHMVWELMSTEECVGLDSDPPRESL